MQKAKLSEYATLLTAVPLLTNAPPFIRVILDNMRPCFDEHGNAQVAIGITGTGQNPYHRITYRNSSGESVLFGCYDGKAPRPHWDGASSGWGLKTMEFEEVEILLGLVSGVLAKKAA